MNEGTRLELTTREGWRKDVPLTQTIAYVGSHPAADVYLPGPDVSPRHLQFVPSATQALGYRVINLSNVGYMVQARAGAPRPLAPRSQLELVDGDTLEVSGYRLTYRGGALTSSKIEARLEMAGKRLELDRPLDGVLYIRNAGQGPGVQFVVEIQGFDPRFVRIGSGPMLYPGVERGLAFSLSHPRGSSPQAGEHQLTFLVTAPSGYPGESATATAMVFVAPYFDHRVRVVSMEPTMVDYTLTRGRR
jgi:hypothetical protein